MADWYWILLSTMTAIRPDVFCSGLTSGTGCLSLHQGMLPRRRVLGSRTSRTACADAPSASAECCRIGWGYQPRTTYWHTDLLAWRAKNRRTSSNTHFIQIDFFQVTKWYALNFHYLFPVLTLINSCNNHFPRDSSPNPPTDSIWASGC